MKVLVVGGGGREHAIVDALTRSGRIDTIYCAPGNAGIAAQAECVPIRETEVEALRDFALAHNVTLTVVGPEAALAAGIVDCFRAAGLRIFGPTKAAARIESSKEFAKELMAKYGIPTSSGTARWWSRIGSKGPSSRSCVSSTAGVSIRWRWRRITSGPTMATKGPIRAAWAPTRRCRS